MKRSWSAGTVQFLPFSQLQSGIRSKSFGRFRGTVAGSLSEGSDMLKAIFVVLLILSFVAAGSNADPFSVSRGITGVIINGIIILVVYGLFRLVRPERQPPEADNRAEWLRRQQTRS